MSDMGGDISMADIADLFPDDFAATYDFSIDEENLFEDLSRLSALLARYIMLFTRAKREARKIKVRLDAAKAKWHVFHRQSGVGASRGSLTPEDLAKALAAGSQEVQTLTALLEEAENTEDTYDAFVTALKHKKELLNNYCGLVRTDRSTGGK